MPELICLLQNILNTFSWGCLKSPFSLTNTSVKGFSESWKYCDRQISRHPAKNVKCERLSWDRTIKILNNCVLLSRFWCNKHKFYLRYNGIFGKLSFVLKPTSNFILKFKCKNSCVVKKWEIISRAGKVYRCWISSSHFLRFHF